MKLILLFLSLQITLAGKAQFDVVKYFSDSISFSYEACTSVKEKKKESKSCTIVKSVVRNYGEQIRVTLIRVKNGEVSNEDRKNYEEGDLSSIDFYNSEIVAHKEFNAVYDKKEYTGFTTPAEVYELRLKAYYYKPGFASVSKYFGRSSALAIYMYFPSYSAAQEAKTFLQTLAKINAETNRIAAGGTLQALPVSECGAKDTRYVNKTYGFTLCLDAKETAADLTYEKYNYQYLKDFVLIKGYSDLPFYVCPVSFKGEKDSMVIFKKFEAEFFDKIGADKISKKEIYLDRYTKADATTAHGSHFRGYNVTLKSGEEIKICFEYMLDGNSKFDAICFAYMSPGGLEGAGYSFRNSALLLQTGVLSFK